MLQDEVRNDSCDQQTSGFAGKEEFASISLCFGQVIQSLDKRQKASAATEQNSENKVLSNLV